jgi:hypothetical protein
MYGDPVVFGGELASAQDLSSQLTDSDLSRLLPGVPLHMYSELDDIPLSKLVNSHGVGIILFETKPSQGHWLGLLAPPGKTWIELFDPYGGAGDPWEFDSARAEEMGSDLESLGQDRPLLRVVARASGREMRVNRKRVQAFKPSVQTCGRHVALRLQHPDLDVAQYRTWLTAQREPDETFDDTVVRLTSAVDA